MPLTLRKTGNSDVDRNNERQHLRFRCMCDNRIPNHNAIIPLTFTGWLKSGEEIIGYDGPCRIGTQHSRTYRIEQRVVERVGDDATVAVLVPAAFREAVV